MEEKFKHVLNENEKVLFVTNASNAGIYSALAVSSVMCCMISMMLSFPIGFAISPIWLLITIPVPFVVVLTMVFIFAKKYVDNYFVCLTNERVIIRHGALTTDYRKYAITNVSGNIEINTDQSIFDRKNESACSVIATIELLPVGHGQVVIFTGNLKDGQSFSKMLEKTIKNNAKALKKIEE